MENFEKLKQAFELRKQGLTLRDIANKTGIDYRHLSVIFKYIKDLDNINLSNELVNFYKQENFFLKEKIDKLKEALQNQTNINKQLKNQIVINKVNLRIVKPSFLLLLTLIFFSLGAIGGIYFGSKNSVETILTKLTNLKQKEIRLLEKQNELEAKAKQLKKEEAKLRKEQKEICVADKFFIKNGIRYNINKNSLNLYRKDGKSLIATDLLATPLKQLKSKYLVIQKAN